MINAERILYALDRRLDHEAALAEAVIPDLVELREAFERAKPLVRDLARQAAH